MLEAKGLFISLVWQGKSLLHVCKDETLMHICIMETRPLHRSSLASLVPSSPYICVFYLINLIATSSFLNTATNKYRFSAYSSPHLTLLPLIHTSTLPNMHLQSLVFILLPATLATAIALPGGGTRSGVACGTVHVASYCEANCPGRCVASGTSLNPGSICVCR